MAADIDVMTIIAVVEPDPSFLVVLCCACFPSVLDVKIAPACL